MTGGAARLLALAAAPEAEHEGSLELAGLARLFECADEPERAMTLYEQALGDHLPSESARAARLRLSFLCKRRGEYGRAAELWRELADDRSPADKIALIALEQLAICYEHRLGEPEKAKEAPRRALKAIDSLMASEREKRRARFANRLERLERKQPNAGADKSVCATTALLSWSRSRGGGL